MPQRLLQLLLLLAVVAPAVPTLAFAQDEDEEDDGGDDDDGGEEDRGPTMDDEPQSRRDEAVDQARKRKTRPVREVYKGFYAKLNAGAGWWLGPMGSYTTGTATLVDFSVGYDVLDRLKFTLTIEGSFNQFVNQGIPLDPGSGLTVTGLNPVAQGDHRIFGGTVNLRFGPNFGGQRVKRLHLAFQVGGGVGFSPLLVLPDAVTIPSLHNRAIVLVVPGVGLEYYTRLAHFSIGLDVDAPLAIGTVFGVAIAPSVTIKYTF